MMKLIHGISVIALLWGIGSYTEVVANNLNPDYEYNNYNAFKIMTDMRYSTTEITTEPTTAETTTTTQPTKECLGVFEVSAYCPCYLCSEGYGRETATGARATAGRTIAVDPNVIPYGTAVEINGHTYIAEDCGGDIKGNRIDLFVDTHTETLEWGVRTLNVYK